MSYHDLDGCVVGWLRCVVGWLRSGKTIILIRVSYHDWDGCVVGWLRCVVGWLRSGMVALRSAMVAYWEDYYLD